MSAPGRGRKASAARPRLTFQILREFAKLVANFAQCHDYEVAQKTRDKPEWQSLLTWAEAEVAALKEHPALTEVVEESELELEPA